MDNINDKLRVVAEYDGWVYKEPQIHAIRTAKDNDGIEWTYSIDTRSFDYHTNISTIWLVAKKARDEAEKLPHYFLSDLWVKGESSLSPAGDINKSATTFDTLQLFEAVYSAITLLNRYKNEKI